MLNLFKDLFLGNRYLQGLYFVLFRVALKGMNYDRGHVPNVNGEPYAIKFAYGLLKKPKLLILDVGANRGQYLEMLITQRINFEAYSFEPQKKAFDLLERKFNSYSNIHLEQLALGFRQGSFSLFKDQDSSEFASLHKGTHPRYNANLNQEEKIEMTTLDDYVVSNSIDRIDFLKLDVEGHEIEVLKGAKQMLELKQINMIQFELGIASINSKVFLKDFFELLNDFNIYRILPNGLAQIEYSEFFEIFLTTNYLAVLKDLNKNL